MKYSIIDIKATRTTAEPGVEAYDAEATIIDKSNEKLFVHVNWFDGFTGYTVAKDSSYDYLVGNSDQEPVEQPMEEYESLENAFESDYFDLFTMLDKTLFQMIHGLDERKNAFVLLHSRDDADFEDIQHFYFGSFQSFTYEGETYEACASITSHDGLTFFSTQGDELIESFDDIELAAYSKWFGIYYSLKKSLIKNINKYLAAHSDSTDEINSILASVNS